MRFEMSLHGICPKSTDDPVSVHEAKAEISDPLKDFPNDVDYDSFTEEQLSGKLQEYQKFMQVYQRPLNGEQEAYFWTPERVSALKGGDPLARRCSVNGKLWTLYLHIKKTKGTVFPESIKEMIRKEIVFARLYPSSQDLVKYGKTQGKPLPNAANTEKGITMPEHTKALFVSGELKKILQEFSLDGKVTFPPELML